MSDMWTSRRLRRPLEVAGDLGKPQRLIGWTRIPQERRL